MANIVIYVACLIVSFFLGVLGHNETQVYRCNDTVTIVDSSKVCDWSNDCPYGDDEARCGNCHFNDPSNLCGYSIVNLNADFGFNFSDHDISTYGLGDEDSGWKHYLIASGSQGQAKLISPIIQQSYGLYCHLSFYYQFGSLASSSRPSGQHNREDAKDVLRIYLNLLDINENVLIWQSSLLEDAERAHRRWRQFEVRLGRIKHPFRVRFEVSSLSGNVNFHKIRDIHFHLCDHPVKDREQYRCSEYDFACRNRMCVEQYQVCDFYDDCADGSDEFQCPSNLMTSFEFGSNGWGMGGKRGWKMENGESVHDLRIAPTYDHTFGYGQGAYLLASVNLTSGPRDVDNFEIDSPAFIPRGECRLTFYYFKNLPTSRLDVYLKNEETGSERILGHVEEVAVHWNSKSFEIPKQTTIFKVVFRAVLPTNDVTRYMNNYVAIDDISFCTGCHLHV